MSHRFQRFILVVLLLPSAALAGQAPTGYNITAKTQVRIGEDRLQLTGQVELEQGDGKLYADEVELFTKEDRAVATGNVVFTQGNNRIAADRAEFNTKTRLGTFYHASGLAIAQPPRQPVNTAPGFTPLPIQVQKQVEVYFFGDVVEKIGPKKYRISNGGFSTCVQPTPRWDLHADTVVLNIDHYTLLKQAVFNVKGVPLLYLPFLYYPTKEDDRATGFLIPTYGNSTIRGQTIHNAFFWAIDRSQDATIMHDWYSKTGQGVGAEYRYNWGRGSDGFFTGYWLDQQATTYDLGNGSTGTLAAERSYEIRGNANQPLPGGLRARGSVNYFSSLTASQTLNSDVFDTSRNLRRYGGNVVGAWRFYSLNGTYDRSEYFYGRTSSAITGSTPRVNFSRMERPLFRGSPLYASVASEVAHFDNKRTGGDVVDDRGLARLDFTPTLRYPFKRWQWFTVNTAVSWRDTYYSRSIDLAANEIVDTNLNRQYVTMQAHAVGPVFNRVWNTPDNGYAEKFKHTIEPAFSVARTTAIDDRDRIVVFDGADTVVGDNISYTYGITNRFYAKRRRNNPANPAAPGIAQEIVSVDVRQSYYSNDKAAQVDSRYQTSFGGGPPSNFSPIQVNVRTTPATSMNAMMSAEIDSRYLELRTLSVGGVYNAPMLQATASWSRRFFIREVDSFNDPARLDHSVNAVANAHTRDNRYGGIYSFNYDFLRSALIQQKISVFYNAQCCGIAFEFQRFNFNGLGSVIPVPADNRFFLSFTLAGLGNFSPFSGAMNGVPR